MNRIRFKKTIIIIGMLAINQTALAAEWVTKDVTDEMDGSVRSIAVLSSENDSGESLHFVCKDGKINVFVKTNKYLGDNEINIELKITPTSKPIEKLILPIDSTGRSFFIYSKELLDILNKKDSSALFDTFESSFLTVPILWKVWFEKTLKKIVNSENLFLRYAPYREDITTIKFDTSKSKKPLKKVIKSCLPTMYSIIYQDFSSPSP